MPETKEPMVLEFEGCLSSFQVESLEYAMSMTFEKVRWLPRKDKAEEMRLRRFKVVVTEIKEW